MSMFIRSQRFPISTGSLVSIGRAGLIARGWSATGLTVQGERPEQATRRMVTVRDDGGAQLGRIQSRRQGVNVWADSAVDAENMSLDLISAYEASPNGNPITRCYGFSSPVKVPTDAPIVVGGKNLTNFYFAFIADVKASAA